jgi:Ser/Thr protein kinase RdoA (MazF antagonist)
VRATQLVALVEERYGVEVDRATPFYDEPEKAIYRLDVVSGLPLVVRLFPPDRPTERVEGDGEILRFLAEHHLPVEHVVPAVDGRATSCSEGRGVLVTRLIPGGAPVLSADSLEQMGALLGRLHALPAPAPGEEHLARRAGSLPRDDLALAGQWLASAHTRLPPDRRGEHDVLRGAIDATHDCEDSRSGSPTRTAIPAT